MNRRISVFNRFGIGSAILLAIVLGAITLSKDLLSRGFFDLHGECYRWIPSLVALHVVSDTAIGLAYLFISIILFTSFRLLHLPFQSAFLAFSAFIICCATTHFVEVITTLWTPIYWLAGFLKLLTAIVSVWTAILLPSLIPQVRTMLANAKNAQEHNREIANLYGHYKALIDAMPLLVWVENKQDGFEFFNAMWASYTGYPSEQLLQEAQKGSLMSSDEYQQAHNYWLQQRQRGVAHETEMRLKRHDGTLRWHLIRMTPLIESDGTVRGWISTATDIDKQKRNELALHEARLQQDTFLTMVSHELKTPLTSMQLLISFLLREITDKKYERAFSTVENQLQRIVRLVNDLLDMSRIKADQLSFTFVTCDAITLAREAVDRMQLGCSTHEFLVDCGATAQVYGDPDRLEQVIVNLLTNATKYSPEADHIDINISVDEHNFLFAVQDYGIGMSQEAQVHIFEQYYRANQKYPGLGIGLYITSEIVKRHHGRIWITSEEGKGSTFTFSLPLKKEDNENEKNE